MQPNFFLNVWILRHVFFFSWRLCSVPHKHVQVLLDSIKAVGDNAALVESLATPAIAERLVELGAAPNRLDRAAFTALVEADMKRWAQIVRDAGIKAD